MIIARAGGKTRGKPMRQIAMIFTAILLCSWNGPPQSDSVILICNAPKTVDHSRLLRVLDLNDVRDSLPGRGVIEVIPVPKGYDLLIKPLRKFRTGPPVMAGTTKIISITKDFKLRGIVHSL
jgi:hypothetical protein